jgi:N-acetylmuramoyl-L-alanine amidase
VLRRLLLFAIFLFLVGCSAGARPTTAQQPGPPPQQPSASPAPQTSPAQTQTPAPSAAIPAPPARVGPTIIIDPAHGGTDNGAQGASGIVEKDMVLRFARQLRAEFERQGFRVVLTRNDDSNPSYEDRAATANAYHDAIFISLHVASTGKLGTAQTYSYQYASPGTQATDAAAAPAGSASRSLVPWEEAQRPYLETSHRFADLVQVQLGLRFSDSPSTSKPFAVRELRSVAAPAVAVELSSVAVPDANMLYSMGFPLMNALVRSVQLFRPAPAASGNISGVAVPAAGAK